MTVACLTLLQRKMDNRAIIMIMLRELKAFVVSLLIRVEQRSWIDIYLEDGSTRSEFRIKVCRVFFKARG